MAHAHHSDIWVGRDSSLNRHRGSFHYYYYYLSRLADLLAKDSTSIDPAHVINISSIASIVGETEDFLSASGSGVWSCKSYSVRASVCFILHFVSDGPSKAAGDDSSNAFHLIKDSGWTQ